MEQRSTVPPRREALIQQYTAAHEAACIAKDEAEKVQGWAEAANDRRDFTGASHFWERSHRETGKCRRHREIELELRKEEYALYNHLDSESEREGLFKLIQYSERRIERLNSEMSKRLVKSRICHLKQYVVKQEHKARMVEKQILEEDLRNKAKGRSNIAFGSGWEDAGSGWGHRPPQRRDVHQNAQAQAASRLRWLEGQRKYALQQAEASIEEIRQNEQEWEGIRAQERAREAEWTKLDDDARRHWAALPVREYEADAYRALEKRKQEEEETRRLQAEGEREKQEKLRAQRMEQQRQMDEKKAAEVAKAKAEDQARERQEQELERERQKHADEQARWEEDYALEEDPTFAWQPNQTEAPEPKSQLGAEQSFTSAQQTRQDANPDSTISPVPASQDILEDQGWGADFDRALREGSDHLKVGYSSQSEIDESMFEEFLEQSAFDDDKTSNPSDSVLS